MRNLLQRTMRKWFVGSEKHTSVCVHIDNVTVVLDKGPAAGDVITRLRMEPQAYTRQGAEATRKKHGSEGAK